MMKRALAAVAGGAVAAVALATLLMHRRDVTLHAAKACEVYAALEEVELAPYWSAATKEARATMKSSKSNHVVVYAHRTAKGTPSDTSVTFELVRTGGYRYEPDEAYVNFAAKKLGGGVLEKGFVQEEIGTFESNLLPLLYDKASWLQGLVKRRDLSLFPVVLRMMHLFDLKMPDYYGRDGRRALLLFQKPDDIDAWAPPPRLATRIYWVSMAAVNLHRMPTLTSFLSESFRQMLCCAEDAFEQTALLLQEAGKRAVAIRTGNWGAGAFYHKVPAVCVLQLAAAARASRRAGPIKLVYYAYEERYAVLLHAMEPELSSTRLWNLADTDLVPLLVELHRGAKYDTFGDNKDPDLTKYSEIGARLKTVLQAALALSQVTGRLIIQTPLNSQCHCQTCEK
jgi:hypothetical protein